MKGNSHFFGSLPLRVSIISVKRFCLHKLVFYCITILSFRLAKLEVTYIL